MATITFSIASTPLTGSKAFTGTDADMQNILNWAAVAYGPLIQQLFNPTFGTPSYVPITPTNTQIGVALATATMRSWQGQEVNYRNNLAVAAVAPPTPNTFG